MDKGNGPLRQYSLRSLLVLVLGLALIAGLIRVMGPAEGIVAAISGLWLAVCIGLIRSKGLNWLRFAGIVVSLGVLYFVGFQFERRLEICDICHSDRVYARCLVFGTVCKHDVERRSNSDVNMIARDLGLECEHRFQTRRLNRYWGGIVNIEPSRGGIVAFANDSSWYTDKRQRKLRKLVKEDPMLREEFRLCVLEGRDPSYMQWLFRQLEDVSSIENGIKR